MFPEFVWNIALGVAAALLIAMVAALVWAF